MRFLSTQNFDYVFKMIPRIHAAAGLTKILEDSEPIEDVCALKEYAYKQDTALFCEVRSLCLCSVLGFWAMHCLLFLAHDLFPV